MTVPVFVSMSDQKMASLIGAAETRVVVAVPAVRQQTAQALCDAAARIGAEHVSVVLDCDEEVFRLGYGEIEAVLRLKSAGCVVRQCSGLRIGVLICDNRAWIFGPTPLYVQKEVHSDETPNAVALEEDHVERIVSRILPTVVGTSDSAVNVGKKSWRQDGRIEIGHEQLAQHAIDQTQNALNQAPPLAFDIARQVRVFEPYIQYVELSLQGCALQRQTIAIPKALQGIEPTDQLARRLRTTYRLIEQSSDISSKSLQDQLKEIRDNFTRSLGEPWGRVMLRNSRPLFDQRIAEFRERLESHRKLVEARLAMHLQTSLEQLVEHFLPLIQQMPPDKLLGQIVTARLTADQIRAWLCRELEKVFPTPADLIADMKLDVQFRDVTYETLMEDGFGKKLREAFPHVEWDKPFAEFDAARERDSHEDLEREYMNPSRFPVTTQRGLSFQKQKMIDAYNLDELEEWLAAGNKPSPEQEAILEELRQKQAMKK